MVLDLFRERIREPGKPPHAHPHREVMPFGVRRADVLRVSAVSAKFCATKEVLWLCAHRHEMERRCFIEAQECPPVPSSFPATSPSPLVGAKFPSPQARLTASPRI